MKPHKDLVYPAYTHHPYPEVEQWCQDQIGPWNEEWYKLGDDPAAQIFNPGYRSVYYFRTEEQALLFTLKWS